MYRMSLHALQRYFDEHVFTFDAEDNDVDVVAWQYEDQAEAFLRHLGAMMSLERFVTLMDDQIVYARRVAPGLEPVKTSSHLDFIQK